MPQAQKKATQQMTYLERLSQRSPDFPVPLRAHTVWEGMTVKLSCTVQGCPPPKVEWYKNGKPLIVADLPWKYSFQQSYGLNFLEIRRLTIKCKLNMCTNKQVIHVNSIHSFCQFLHLPYFLYNLICILPLKSECLLSLLAVQLQPEAQFDTTFTPTWAKEGCSFTLHCTFTSPLLPFQQDVSWFRDGVQLHQSSTTDIKTCDNKATITIKAAHKEHEGVYTANSVMSLDCPSLDASAAALGSPASPLAVQVSDVNRDYVFLTWQPPSADGASPIQGYIVERCEQGQDEWVRCNVHMQKMCHFPVFEMKEKTLYQFRVRAVNQAGAGRPSKATEAVLTGDPLEHTRTTVGRGKAITITKDELEGQIRVPFPPTDVHACEVSDSYVVLRWTEPEPRGREPLTFYVEQSLAGQKSWGLASLDMVVSSPRFPVFGLAKEKQYCFRVRSVNKYGVSDPSESTVPAPPHSVIAIRDTDTSVLLQWEEPADKDGILGYYLYYSETAKQNWKTVNNKPVVKTRFTVHGLKTRREYVFRVKSVSRAGNSRYSDESGPIMVKSAINVPSAPSAICLLLCTGSEMVLGWRAPSCKGGNPVQGYYLDQREKGTETWREVNVKPAKKRQFKVSDLTQGHFYQFRVFAANLAGVGKPSDASEAFLCEKWTMPQPGCPYDLEIREVRNGSLVLLWATPLYEGRAPVTGYLLEISQGDQSEDWTSVNKKTISDTHYKVAGLQAGETYRLRVSAVNQCGVGRASLPSEPVTVQTRPGTKDIEIGVDDDGFIFLGYEASEINSESEFIWSRNYTDPTDATRLKTETKNNRSVLTFRDPSVEDLGLYTVEMSDNPHLSSRSHDHSLGNYAFLCTLINLLLFFIPLAVIALKSGWEVEVSEKGGVRLWLQTESLSNAAELRLICNDHEISGTPHRKINFDKAKGLLEILFDQLSQEDKGSYTAQLRDGRAKNQFTLLLVDQSGISLKCVLLLFIFKGPHFQEFLTWSVNEDCELIIKCKVHLRFKPCFKQKLYCILTYLNKKYVFEKNKLALFFYLSEKQIDQETRSKPGSSMKSVWIEILNPTEKDKGKYTLEMFDGKETHKRTLELSEDAFAELICCFFVFSDRAKVTKGLPDVVAIMEGKSLCLTCFIDGEPAPEIFWLRNDREILDQTQFTITKEPKRSSITVNEVHMEDSGKYSIFVRNQYGSETVDVTVSVYRHGDKPPANAVEMG
uniref:Myomesin 3 n=1 Tax=Oryzias latipes TaxID=8090 RepID=A0A3P9LA78_ORYLA